MSRSCSKVSGPASTCATCCATYVDYSTQRDEVIARARPLGDLERYNDPAKVAAALAAIRAVASHPDRLRYLPVQGPKEDLTAIIDSGDAAMRRCDGAGGGEIEAVGVRSG